MEADFRVDSIFVDEELGEMFAKCYDNVYGEEFEKFLGSPGTEEGRQNALTILEDGTYTMTDELRNEFISIFDLDDYGKEVIEVEEEDDLYDDSEDEVVESFSIREALNKIDLYNDNKYDLLNLYESCTLNENEKRELGKLLYDQADSSVIYDTLNKKYISEIDETIDIMDDDSDNKDLDEDLNKDILKSKLEKATREFITNTLGYDDDFVDDYIFVEVKEDKFSDGTEAIKCEIRTELDYEECVDLSTHLNPIVMAEDKNAYFDMEDAHTLAAYIRTDFSDDVVDEETVSEYADLIKDISSMEELRNFYRDIRDLFEDRWTSATFEKVNDLIMDKADELNKDESLDESANDLMIYLFPELTDEDLEMAKAYGLQFLGKNHGANGDEDNWVLRGQEAALRRYADKYLGYELHPDYLYDEEDFAGDIEPLEESITHSPLSTAGPIPYAVKLLYQMDKFVTDVYDSQGWLMNGVPDGEFEETTPDEAMQNYTEHAWLIEDEDSPDGVNWDDFNDFIDTFKRVTKSKDYDQKERNEIIDEADTLIREYAKYSDEKLSKMLDESKSLKESNEDEPYTKEEVETDLKSITHNFTDKEGDLKCGFEEEKNFAVEILKQHYIVVETSGDDRRDGTWYHISFAGPIEK